MSSSLFSSFSSMKVKTGGFLEGEHPYKIRYYPNFQWTIKKTLQRCSIRNSQTLEHTVLQKVSLIDKNTE